MFTFQSDGKGVARHADWGYYLAISRMLDGLIAILPVILYMGWHGQLLDMLANHLVLLVFIGTLTVLVFQAFILYDEAYFSHKLQFRRTLLAWCAAFAALLLLHNELGLFGQLPGQQMLLWFASALAFFGIKRLAFLALAQWRMRHGAYLQKAVILGATPSGEAIADYLRHNGDVRLGVIGFIDDRVSRTPAMVAGLPYLGDSTRLIDMIRDEQVQVVLVALPWQAEARINALVTRLRQLPVRVLLTPDMQGLWLAQSRIIQFAGVPLFNMSQPPLQGWSSLAKRIEDLLIAGILTLLLAPLMLLIAIWIKLDSRGPVLFRQKRYGYNNHLIEVFKFRTMFVDQTDADADQQTTRDDPRVTRAGHFLRKSSLDELPQLFNVLQGTMSMVGPRPHAKATKAAGVLFEEAVQEYSARHRVKPGITGWAQIHGFRGETDTIEKIQHRVTYDLEYIETWSIWLDLSILCRTIPAVLFQKEAY
ncbi:undecaprenyl-phosphate glucose phosphotransferase [Corticibacter populi]|uniref:Undecaprenyl-phosphate glucose phosphotransferase n=1 Tax=Corticibacter populi TaxID=1550736 RepID=A0A3M6QKI3_9BURK|nr:undecaprenyl-phosphate glucose phosphotransferase [Corticibacter populi]RMX03537.1 undecaprenyl-phosphate glucose phosphotransferase [Corticibacter populi]RZS29988.1 Undecaprenyl-phosphate glucose phosphotransferase [Corticibacter populi]